MSLSCPPFKYSNVVYKLFYTPRFWLMLLMLVAWSIRLYQLGSMSLWWDETLSWTRAQQDVLTIISNQIEIQGLVTRDLHPPFYFLLLHFTVKLFGASEFALRAVSVFANLLTIPLLYTIARWLARKGGIPYPTRIGYLTAVFAAFSPFYVWYSQETRPYATLLLLSLLTVYTLLKSMDMRTRRRRLYFLAFCLTLLLTMATNYLAFVLLPFFALIPRIFSKRSRLWWGCSALLLGAFAVAMLILPSAATALAGSESSGPQYQPLAIILRDVVNSFVVGVTANIEEVAWFDLLIATQWVLGVSATIHIPRRDARIAIFLVSFLVLPILCLQLGSLLRPLYLNSRYLITISPAFYIGLAFGVNGLAVRASRGEQLKSVRYVVATSVAVGIFISGVMNSLENYFYNPTYAKDDHKGWAELLRERALPNDFLILNAPHAETIYKYYAPNYLKWISLPALGMTEKQQEQVDLNAVLSAYRNDSRVWYLELHRPVADPNSHIQDLLNRYGTPIDVTYFSGTSTEISLRQFVRGSILVNRLPENARRVSVAFEQNLELIGYEVPTEAEVGSRSAVTLYWRLAQKSVEEVRILLRVVDDKGTVWGEWDSPPIGNLVPLRRWQPRMTLRDLQALTVDSNAPPGKYALELNVYHAGSGEPLTAFTRKGIKVPSPLRLATFQVTTAKPTSETALGFTGAEKIVDWNVLQVLSSIWQALVR